MNSLDIYERNCLSPLEEKEQGLKVNENNQKNKKQGGVPKLNFFKWKIFVNFSEMSKINALLKWI